MTCPRQRGGRVRPADASSRLNRRGTHAEAVVKFCWVNSRAFVWNLSSGHGEEKLNAFEEQCSTFKLLQTSAGCHAARTREEERD